MPPVPIQGWVLHAREKEVTLEAGFDGQQVVAEVDLLGAEVDLVVAEVDLVAAEVDLMAVEVDLVEGEGRLEGGEAAHTTHPASSSRPPT